MRRAMARLKALSELHKQGARVRTPSHSLRLASSMYHFRDVAEIWKKMYLLICLRYKWAAG